MSTLDHRCGAKCQVVLGQWKRCVRSVGHTELHLWVEDLTRSDGFPILIEWSADLAEVPDIEAVVGVRDKRAS